MHSLITAASIATLALAQVPSAVSESDFENPSDYAADVHIPAADPPTATATANDDDDDDLINPYLGGTQPPTSTPTPTQPSVVVADLEARAATLASPYPTSFSPIPWDNAGYAAMTASQHSAYCQSAAAKKGTPAYTQACVYGIWGSLYGRSVGADEDGAVTSVAVGDAAAVPTTFATVVRATSSYSLDGGDVDEEASGAEFDINDNFAQQQDEEEELDDGDNGSAQDVTPTLGKRNLANFFTRVLDLFKKKTNGKTQS